MILNVDLALMEVKRSFEDPEVTLTALTARFFDIRLRRL